MTQGRGPGEPLRGDVIEGSTVRSGGWEWSEMVPRRGLPWIGIFLVVFGGLLLLREFVPQLEGASGLLTLALGIAFLISWAINRGTGSLYLGAILTALAAPDLLQAAGVNLGEGLGTFCLGLAFLAIAGIRAASGRGVGWQAYLGLALALIGGSQLAIPGLSDVVWPVLVLGAGVVLLVSATRRP